MPFHPVKEVTPQEIFPGFRGRFVHGEQMTVIQWEVETGAILPEHSHPEEQITTVLSGSFELTINGETRVLTAGDVAVIPSNAVHSGKALSACTILDAVSPSRKNMCK